MTYVAAVGNNADSMEMRYEDENIWLTQKMMAQLYDVSVQNIGQHIKKVLDDGELTEDAVVKKYFITAADGKQYSTKHYNLQMIIAVGFKVNNDRAVRFRKWSGQIVKDYTIQGWTMDKEHMGLTTWDAAPDGKIVKMDVSIAKNYLNDKEMSYMERICRWNCVNVQIILLLKRQRNTQNYKIKAKQMQKEN